MLRLFLKNANTKGQRTILKEKIKFAFGDAGGLNQEQAINIFNDCAETPQSLKDYLEQVTTE